MIKLLTLAMAFYFIFSLAACVTRAAPKAGSTPPPAAVMDADYTQESPVVDAQFAHVPEIGEETPPMLLMIDGQLYRATGQDSDIDGRCGMMDARSTAAWNGARFRSRTASPTSALPVAISTDPRGRSKCIGRIAGWSLPR